MNREDTKKAIEVMQAFVDGEAIEYRLVEGEPWLNWAGPNWDWVRYEFRIKPNPREFQVFPYIVSDSLKFAADTDMDEPWTGAIKVREVIE